MASGGRDSRIPVPEDLSAPAGPASSLSYGGLSREGGLGVGSNATVCAATGPDGTRLAVIVP